MSSRPTHPSIPPESVNEYQLRLGRQTKAGMVHSVSGWTRGVQVKLWDPLRKRAIPERLTGVFTTRRYTNPRLPLPYLLLIIKHNSITIIIFNSNNSIRTAPYARMKIIKLRYVTNTDWFKLLNLLSSPWCQGRKSLVFFKTNFYA